MTHSNFTRSDLDAAASYALDRVANDPIWTRAIKRAMANLQAGQFSFDGTYVKIHSASREKSYVVDTREPMKCTCEGREKGLVCWHITAARLILRAAQINATQSVYYKGFLYTADELAAAARHQSPERLQAAVDELFA